MADGQAHCVEKVSDTQQLPILNHIALDKRENIVI